MKTENEKFDDATEKALDRIADASILLRQKGDNVNKQIADYAAELNRVGATCTTMKEIPGGWYFGWRRSEKKGWDFCAGAGGQGDFQRLVDAPLSIRLAAVKLIPELIREIAAKMETLAGGEG